MTSPEQQPLVPKSDPLPDPWNPDAIAEVLETTAEPRIDHLHGQGVRFRVGEPPGTELELFPATHTVRLTGEDLQLSLFRQGAPTLAPEGVIFELRDQPERRWLAVSPTGATTLFYNPDIPARPETPQHATITEKRPITPYRQEAPLLDDATAPQGASLSLLPHSAERQEQQERVQLAGRLGTEVRYRTTRSGKLVAKFPLAIKADDGSTTWKDVLLFGERADRLREGTAPTKGQYVEVIGYVHEREVKGRHGTTRTVSDIYAVVVKTS
jgi:hypothetical protein